MIANEKSYSMMYGKNSDCMRTPGGKCVGNCMPRPKTETINECLRTPGGKCVGNCMPRPKNEDSVKLIW